MTEIKLVSGDVVGYWNPETETVQDLRARLALLKLQYHDALDMAHLPSMPIPKIVERDYPVWACDSHQDCLVGYGARISQPLEEIMEFYQYLRQQPRKHQHPKARP